MALLAAGALFLQGTVMTISDAHADAPFISISDPFCDVKARQTDPGGKGLFDPELHHLPNLLAITVGLWAPIDPQVDPFSGSFDEFGLFFRIDVVLDQLINPPGSVDPSDYNPFSFGDHPLYGFLEIDMDGDNNTGGELDAPQFRYLGNVARFGGIPTIDDNDELVAVDASAFDEDFTSEPHVERSGEEFHLVFLGKEFGSAGIFEKVGDGDLLFEEGETWDIQGKFFHRAHGFEPFSFAKGGMVSGEYVPTSVVRFQHDAGIDRTTVSLVFPLTNDAAALMLGEPAEPINSTATDQASVLEALEDLVSSAQFLEIFPTGLPEEEIIIGWQDRNASEELDPREWKYSVLFGTSLIVSTPNGPHFVWSDVYPNVITGDVDGDDDVDSFDQDYFDEYILAEDSKDGTVDGQVEITDFASDFSLYDINYSGVVSPVDFSDAQPATVDGCPDIAALSQWGMIALTLALAVVGTLMFGRVRGCA